jgi:hypothetical protein
VDECFVQKYWILVVDEYFVQQQCWIFLNRLGFRFQDYQFLLWHPNKNEA